jgi:hypothetical protein
MRSLKPGVDHAKQVAYCLDGGRVGIGWGIDELPTGTPLADVLATIRANDLPGWGSRAASTVRLFGEEAAVGDFLWTRDLQGRFRLGRITGRYRYDNSAKAKATDTHQVRKAEWADRSLGDLEVPGAIVRAFSGRSTAFSRMLDISARIYTGWLWEKLHGREPPPFIRAHLEALVGRDVRTVSGRPNRILRVDGELVFVRTGSTGSPNGEPVDVAVLEQAAKRLLRDGELRIDPNNVGYRSAFVGAVLGALPGIQTVRKPARVRLPAVLRSIRSTAKTAAAANDRWWVTLAAERFWLEVSDRERFGDDLRAPDDARTSHALVREVQPKDIVFHYSKRSRSIIGWSEVVGPPRHLDGEYRTKLGGMLGVTRVDLARLRDFDEVVRETASEMGERGYDLRGFPFERSKTRSIRPLPAYLSKLPLRIVETIPELAEAVALSPGGTRPRKRARRRSVGGAYRSANEGVTIPVIRSPESEAWRAEQAAQRTERSTREHNRLQNGLERYLKDHGLPTLSPKSDDVAFDLAWRTANGLAFAEIKSLPPEHASQRLRLGLGQCLFYRHALRGLVKSPVTAFLVVPREPEDPAWPDACAEVDVRLTWPSRFGETLHQNRVRPTSTR